MRTGFTSRFREWIRVLATGRLLLFQVGSRYLKAISSRQEDRELQKEEMEMAYGDGGNWVGRADQPTRVMVSWQVDYESSSSSVEIHIDKNDDAPTVAQRLWAAWIDPFPGEALIPAGKLSTVEFIRKGEQPRCMSIKVGPGVRQTLPANGPAVFVVPGLDVRNV